jgi:hypothetical protein
MLVPSLLKARPALKARTISDSRMAIAKLWLVCGVAFGEQVNVGRTRLTEGRVSVNDHFKVRFDQTWA